MHVNKLEKLEYWEGKLNSVENDVAINLVDFFCDGKSPYLSDFPLDFSHKVVECSKKQKIDSETFLTACTMISVAMLSGKKTVGVMFCKNNVTFPVFIDIYAQKDFVTLVHSLQRNIAEGFEYQMSFSQIVKFVGRHGEHYDENSYLHVCFDPCEVDNYSAVLFDLNESKCILDVYVQKKYHVDAFINVFNDVCLNCLDNPYISPQNLELTKLKYYKNQLRSFSGETRHIPDEINLGLIFKEMVGLYGDSPAIINKEKSISYRLLHTAVLNMADFLLKNGVEKGDRCIVLCRQDIDTIVLLIALLYIGAIIVPLDRKYPVEKLQVTKNNIESKYVFSSVINQNITDLIKIEADFVDYGGDITPVANTDMYITFTSGTTGIPKSIKISCKDFFNLHMWYCDVFGLEHSTKNILLTNFGFDATIKNFVSPLLSGASLVLAGDELFDIREIVGIIETNAVTHINCVPSLFEKILSYAAENNFKQLSSIKTVALGGEKFPSGLAKDWAGSSYFNATLINVYGPAEGTDLSAYYVLNDNDLQETNIIPLGKPLYNKNLYVLDENLYLCPVNEKGELYISGTGVISTYLCNDDNKNRFINHIGLPNHTLYRTGDIVYRDIHGELIYSGRVDNQIKYNGQRIELEELESVIEKHKSVFKCMVKIYQQPSKSDRLVAYCVMKEHITLDKSVIYEHCKKWMNPSMIPSQFVQVEDIKLTTNGKLDRTWEPQIRFEATQLPHEELSDTEGKVLDIWKNVLGVNFVCKDTPFFEAGGSSLLLPQLQKELEGEFDIDISIVDLLELTTISKIADYIDEEL